MHIYIYIYIHLEFSPYIYIYIYIVCVYTHVLHSIETLVWQCKYKKLWRQWMTRAKEIFLRAKGSPALRSGHPVQQWSGPKTL